MAIASFRRDGIVGPAAYGALFVLVLPAALIWWARALDAQLVLPVVHQPLAGALLAAAGSAVWIAGVLEIILRGDGLPMNAFPPARYVTSGIYALVAHPIYVGWTMACAGVSVQTGSAAGLWVVTPAVAAGCAALVLGYERHDLRRRFGASAIVRPWLSLPIEEPGRPRVSERLAAGILTLLPFTAVQLATGGHPLWIDVLSVALAALLTPTRATLRRFVVQGFGASILFVIVCLVGPANGSSAAVHIVWAVFASEAVAARSRAWTAVAFAGLALFVFGVPLAHGGTFGGRDLALFIAAGLLVRRPLSTWRLILDATEWLANSWRAWRLGPVRVISHGVFAGLAAATGVVVIGALAGPASLPAVVVLAVSTLVGAALWAQLVEGSPTLLRPFGYYGGVIGGLVGCAVMAATGQSVGVMLGATAVAVPWVHSLGRLRCLVQGCCHGCPTDPHSGIRVTNPHSRVVALAHLDGRPIHATQLYAIALNVMIGALLLRAWTAGVPVWFAAGLYLIGAGLARFVEEGFRGEPADKITWRGLPIYQYLAAASVLVGVVFTTWGGPPAPAAAAFGDARILWSALAIGAVYWFAMGVDFPESSRRFARLSG